MNVFGLVANFFLSWYRQSCLQSPDFCQTYFIATLHRRFPQSEANMYNLSRKDLEEDITKIFLIFSAFPFGFCFHNNLNT